MTARQHRSHAFLYGGHDPCVCCLSFAAKSLWMLGYPEQALQRGREALVLARELGHPTSLAHTQLSVAILHQFRRDVSETLELAEALQGLAAEQGLLFYLAGGSVLRGWALVERGRSEEGIAHDSPGVRNGGSHARPLACLFPCLVGRGVWQRRKLHGGARRAGGSAHGR